MTKHQYNAYKKQHRQYRHGPDMESDDGMLSMKHGGKYDKNMLKLLQSSQEVLENSLDTASQT